MNLTTIKFTREGFQKVKDDQQILTEKRKAAVIALRTAREMGDLSENGAYKAARFELSGIDRELRRIAYLLRFGEVAETTHSDTIGFGSLVTVDDGKRQITFMLVEKFESNPKDNKLSLQSPIGRAVLGKKSGDQITVSAPRGDITYKITHVK